MNFDRAFKRIILKGTLLFFPFFVFGQNNNAPSSKDPHEIKITGYLQTQYQKASAEGIVSFSGGDFNANSSERFMIRRGRLKIDRVDKYTNIVFQIDATQNGVNLMDAFIQLHEPGKEQLMLTAGLFNRPFGHSVVYSSGYRDFPERSRVFQILMPRERDLGAMVSYSPVKFITGELAMVNGSGLSARDYDSRKDLIGNLVFKFDSLAGKKLHLGFGGSVYQGHVRSNTTTIYSNNATGFSANTDAANKGAYADRNYYGANLQVQVDNSFGNTLFKTEYVAGIQPGVESSATLSGPAASTSFAVQPATNLYLRHFNGYYFWLSQQLGKSKLTALLAYDVYDPNTNIKENAIGATGSNTNAADIKYSTFGYGIAYGLTKQIKFTLYNEHVKNDGTQLAAIGGDIDDNVFTARLQYRW